METSTQQPLQGRTTDQFGRHKDTDGNLSAGFSSLDMMAFGVASIMLLGPLAMAAWGARMVS